MARVRDAAGRIAKAGAVAYRQNDGVVQFALVTAKNHPKRWILPKGHVERGELAATTAVRELREEAGVDGDLIAPLGTSVFRAGRDEVSVRYYLVQCRTQGVPEHGRQRRWLPYEEARAALWFDDSKRLLDKAWRRLAP